MTTVPTSWCTSRSGPRRAVTVTDQESGPARGVLQKDVPLVAQVSLECDPPVVMCASLESFVGAVNESLVVALAGSDHGQLAEAAEAWTCGDVFG